MMVSIIYRSVNIKFILFALVLALTLPNLSHAEEGDGYGRSVGAIVSWSGFVFISRDGLDDMIEVEDNESLYKGDVILTAKGSRAKILLNDDSILNLSGGSTFKIRDFVHKKKKAFRFVSFKMITGSVRTLVSKYFGGKGSGFEIATDTAVVGVKGTDFIVDIAKDGTSEVFSLSGKVTTRGPSEAADKAVILRPGYKTRAVRGKRPTPPEKFKGERVRKLLSKTSIRAGISKEEKKALIEKKRALSPEQRESIRDKARKKRDLLEGRTPKSRESKKKDKSKGSSSRSGKAVVGKAASEAAKKAAKAKAREAAATAAAGGTAAKVVAERAAETTRKKKAAAERPKKKSGKTATTRRRGRLSAKNKSTGASARCSDCHQKVFRAILSYTNPHPDTMSTCITCHIKESSVKKKYSAPDLSMDSLIFLDTKRDMPYIVSATVADESGEETDSELFEFTPSKLKDVMKDGGTLPVVSDPVVVAVKAGMFNSAVLEWKTDKPTLGYVEYGRSSKLGEITKATSKQYSVDHRVSVVSLTVGKTYYFKAVGTDVFGNKGASKPIKFKVKKPFDAPKASKDKVMPKVTGFKVVSVGGRPVLSWVTDLKTTAIITLSEGISREEIAQGDPHYPGLTTDTASGHSSCKDCHTGKLHRTTAHSMGIVSYAGRTVKARELYYGDRGVLICSTCHLPHGGKFPHTLRKNQTDLCDTCHLRQ